MKSNLLKTWEAAIPADSEAFARKYADVVERILHLMQKKGITKKQLANDLDKNPSEVTKWLSGGHNFTMRSLVKLEVELGEDIIRVPKTIAASTHHNGAVQFTLLVNDVAPMMDEFESMEGGHFIPFALTGS